MTDNDLSIHERVEEFVKMWKQARSLDFAILQISTRKFQLIKISSVSFVKSKDSKRCIFPFWEAVGESDFYDQVKEKFLQSVGDKAYYKEELKGRETTV